MAQHTQVARALRRYTRTDYTALRARLANRLSAETVLRLYYNEDELSERGIHSVAGVDRHLDDMRDDLISRLVDSNPFVADALASARSKGVWSKAAIDFLVAAADQKSTPRPQDAISAWFLPIAAKRLKSDGHATMADLINCIRVRGAGWFRPIPCIGEGKAAKIHAWLLQHKDTLGDIPLLTVADDSLTQSAPVLIAPDSTNMVPLERMYLAAQLDGRDGINRNAQRPLVQAANDLEILKTYLYKHRENPKTYRAYQKELERFLLWCIKVRKKPLSSVLVEDCEAYKDFLAAIPDDWIASRQKRNSPRWRPFAGQISRNSCKFAITILRTFFAWAIDIRYLSGNPWVAVAQPKTHAGRPNIQIEKALPAALWEKLSAEDGILDELATMGIDALRRRYPMRGIAGQLPLDAQWRLVRATLLLIGHTGIRREEAALATRDHLKPYPDQPGLYELAILGKRSKWRDVFLPNRVVDAISAHWRDRDEDFSFGMSKSFLLSPVIIPPTALAQEKHATPHATGGFSPEGIYTLVTTALKRIADDESFDLTDDERVCLRRTGVHAFRHTYGKAAVAGEVPLDVVQQTLGHASLSTTTIYTQSEKKRKASEMGRFFGPNKK